VPPYKRIRCIQFTDLPKTVSGKIRRVELRMQEQARRRSGQWAENEYWEKDLS
jgi:acetyl-CoA synthetase